MDIFLIVIFFICMLIFEYVQNRSQRSRTVNRCYMLLMLISASMLLINFLLPDAPKIVNMISALFLRS